MISLEGVSPFEHPFIMGREACQTGGDRGPVPPIPGHGVMLICSSSKPMGIAGCEVLCRVEITEPGSACLALDEFLEKSRGAQWPLAGAWLFLSLEP